MRFFWLRLNRGFDLARVLNLPKNDCRTNSMENIWKHDESANVIYVSESRKFVLRQRRRNLNCHLTEKEIVLLAWGNKKESVMTSLFQLNCGYPPF